MKRRENHHISKRKTFDLLIVPSEDASRTTRFRLSRTKLVLLILGVVFIITALIFGILGYTPVGKLVPVSQISAEEKYGTQVSQLSEKMSLLVEEVENLRAYNDRLRSALGMKIDTSKSKQPSFSSPVGASASGSESSPRQLAGFDEQHFALGPSPASLYGQEGIQARQSGSLNLLPSFPAILPMEGYVSRGFNPEIRHYGLDMVGKKGATVNAAADGYVVFAEYTIDDGYMIIVTHTNGFLTVYKHLETILASQHQWLKRGEPIGIVGNTGRLSYGPHLHFEIWKDNSPVNPALYLINIFA